MIAQLLTLGGLLSADAVKRALRTFVITTLGLFIPGLLGWLNDLTTWAQGNGTKPFPDGHGLAYLGVSAIVAGVVAVINLVWNTVEDISGKAMLRSAATPARKRNQVGSVAVLEICAVIVAIVALLWLFGVHPGQ